MREVPLYRGTLRKVPLYRGTSLIRNRPPLLGPPWDRIGLR
jgi:hypothetical protein